VSDTPGHPAGDGSRNADDMVTRIGATRAGRLLKVVVVVALLLVGGPVAPVWAQDREEILAYDVQIELVDGNRLVVTEDITVRALGREIRRGIYRDFPTSFPRSSGLGRIEAPFEVLDVTRGGAPEPWTLERIGGANGRGGVRVRIGDADVFLEDGVHRYSIRYSTSRWIDHGETSDQLYWNVTGNGWGYPIESATARISFPREVAADSLTLEAWTGPEGSTESNARVSFEPSTDVVSVATTEGLGPREGLTVRVTFPTGIVRPATEAQQAAWFRMDWGGYIDAGVVLFLVILLYLLLWVSVGRDPERDPIQVRYEPPEGYSPAALGYLENRGYQNAQLTATVVNLAVRGLLRIEKLASGWRLQRTEGATGDGLPTEEASLFGTLLGSRTSLDLEAKHSSTMQAARNGLRRRLGLQLEKRYFVLNRRWFAAGLAFSLAGFALLAWRDRFSVAPEAWFLGVWLTFWTLGTATLAWRVSTLWISVFRGGGLSAIAPAVFLTLFATPFVVAEIVVAALLVTRVPLHLVLATVALGSVNVVFYHLLERPTLRGRGVLDRLEGFKRFLTAAEADRMDRLTEPERTPELFERYLPYAVALGVENRWAEQFAGVVAAGATAERTGSGALGWYGGGGASGLSGMTSSLGGAFSSTLSSASSPPPSSSSGGGGGGGGGSSGGGGGGGGGGGW